MDSVEILPRAPPRYRTSIHTAAAKTQNAAVYKTASRALTPPLTADRPVNTKNPQPDMIRGKRTSARPSSPARQRTAACHLAVNPLADTAGPPRTSAASATPRTPNLDPGTFTIRPQRRL